MPGLLTVFLAAAGASADEPVKVFIMAGQSNMQGHVGKELIDYQITQPDTKGLYEHLRKDGEWIVRKDVWIKFWEKKGGLSLGYGLIMGPELQFGWVVGDHYDQQVLIIKTATGGASLYRDFRSPSAGYPPQEVLQKEMEKAQEKEPDTTMEDIKQRYGRNYRRMMDEVNDTLKNLKEHFSEYQGQGYEIAGFVWFQGWNDMINRDYTAAYTENMAHFIRDVRKDLGVPKMPLVIGQMGVDGVADRDPNSGKNKFKAAQAAAAEIPEFKGNVALVKTDVYWDVEAQKIYDKGWREHLEEWKKIGSNRPYHYLGSAKTMLRIGGGFAEAMIALQQKK